MSTLSPPVEPRNSISRSTSFIGASSIGPATAITMHSASSTPPAKAISGCSTANRISGASLRWRVWLLTSAFKFVANAPDRLNVGWLGGVRFDLLAQPPHMDCYGAVIAVEFEAPYLIEKLGACEHLAWM